MLATDYLGGHGTVKMFLDLGIPYLRDLAFEYLPDDKKSLVSANLEMASKKGEPFNDAYIAVAVSMMEERVAPLRAVEIAAARVLFCACFYEDIESGMGEEGAYSYLMDLALDLAQIAEISLPEWLTENFNLVLRVDSLRQEVEALKAEVAHLEAKSNDGDSRLSKEKSLHKLIIGMAIDAYHYDPSKARNNAIGDIERSLERQGLGMDRKTIKKYLDEARALFSAKPIDT